MSTLQDLDAKRIELNNAIDTYKQTVSDFNDSLATQQDVDNAKAAAQAKGDEYAKLALQVKQDNPSLTTADLFSRSELVANGRFENVAQIMTTGSLSPETLIELLGETVGSVFDPTVLSSLFTDDAKTSPMASSGQAVGAMESVGAHSQTLLQTSSDRRPIYNEADGFKFISPDGNNDWLQSPDLLASDELTIVYAIKRPVDNRFGRVFDSRGTGAWVGSGEGGNQGVKGIMIKADASTNPCIIIEDGNGHAWSWDQKITANVPTVATVRWDGVNNQGLYRINGVVQAPGYQDANMGSVATTGTHRMFAALDGLQTFAGSFYGAIIAHRVLTDDEIQIAETLLAGRCGATLA